MVTNPVKNNMFIWLKAVKKSNVDCHLKADDCDRLCIILEQKYLSLTPVITPLHETGRKKYHLLFTFDFENTS